MTQTPLKTGEMVFHDLMYYVTYEVYEYHLDVKAYPIFQQFEDGGELSLIDGKIPLVDRVRGGSPITDPEQAEIFVSGFVKWEGCSNWSFHTEECMAHFCTRTQLVQVGTLLSRLYDLAADLIPKWND